MRYHGVRTVTPLNLIALDYDLKAISRAIVSTKAYNTLATREAVDGSKPYYFQGPLLRRMSAEQVWDSLLTLMVEDPYAYALGLGIDERIHGAAGRPFFVGNRGNVIRQAFA